MHDSREIRTLLFEGLNGDRVAFEDVMDDGLDGGYEERVPALVSLLSSADSAEHQVLGAALLIAWGQRAGFDSTIHWLKHPPEAPWSPMSSSVSSDRFPMNDALPVLVDAARTSLWNDESQELRSMQGELLHSILELAQRTYLGPNIGLTVARSELLNAELHGDLISAVNGCLVALGEPHDDAGFDLAMQAARLILALARTDDEAAANAASELLALRPRELVVREVVQSLGEGDGPATAALLEEHALQGTGTVATEAREVLLRRSR